MASLRHVDARTYDLVGDRVTLGRDPTNDVVLAGDPKISRSHVGLERREGQWVLLDLDSRNGTTVNGRRVHRHPLREGDRIEVGGTLLTFVAGEDENATEIAAAQPHPAADLSVREKEILGLVAQGLTDRAIGEHLFISVSTVRSHLDRIKEKTGLRRRPELTRFALQAEI
jgi:pSer/pThr/pTyr-binding forkhead associated (FHA) protein